MIRFIFLSLVCGTTYATSSGLPKATVRNGTYVGLHSAEYGQDMFLGMPYAQPPIGDLRFRAPKSLNNSWDGQREAVSYSDICMQYTAPPDFPMSENCLTLNIIRPSTTNSSGLPVAVWIHGGGLYSGSSRNIGYNLSNLVRQSEQVSKPIIGVSINYRLTAFGFLWGSNETKINGSSNNGLRDQRLALQWIQENIAAFGGDPTKVTIWGQSSGALSVGRHITAYGGRDDKLFRAAIMESGSMVEKWPYNINDPELYAQHLYHNLTTSTACANETSPLECLRNLPLESLSAALNITDTEVFPGTGLGPWLTVKDDDFIQDTPVASLRKARFVPVPIIYGTTSDESSVFGPSNINTDDELDAAIAAGGPDGATIEILKILYPNVNAIGLPAGYEPLPNDTYGLQWKRSVALFTDIVETAPRRLVADTWAAHNATAYIARFNAIPLGTSAALGAHHSSEVSFVFNNVGGSQYDNDNLQDLSVLMSRMWVSFIHDLDPNNHGLTGYPVWPKWLTSLDQVGQNFVFDGNGGPDVRPYIERDDYRLAQTRYINSVLESQMKY